MTDDADMTFATSVHLRGKWAEKKRDLRELLGKQKVNFFFWFFVTGGVGVLTSLLGILSLSMMGYGAEVVGWILEVDPSVINLARGGGIFIMLMLYMLDFFTAPHLRGTPGAGRCIMGNQQKSLVGTIVARKIFCFSLALAAAWCFLAVKSYPHYPVMVVLVVFIVLQVVVRLVNMRIERKGTIIQQLRELGRQSAERIETFQQILVDYLLAQHDRLLYYKALTASTLVVSFLVCTVFNVWAFILPQNYWGAQTRHELRSDNVVATDPKIGNKDVAHNLQFNIWAAPAMLALGYFLFFSMFFLRTKLHVAYSQSDELLDEVAQAFVDCDEERADAVFGVGKLEKVVHTVRMCVCGLMAIALGIWVGAEVSVGASNSDLDVGATVRTYLLGFALIFTVFIVSTMHKVYRTMVKEMWRNPFLQMMVTLLKSDWMKAVFIMPLWFVIPLYAFVSALNQLVRKCRKIQDRQNYHRLSGGTDNFQIMNQGEGQAPMLHVNSSSTTSSGQSNPKAIGHTSSVNSIGSLAQTPSTTTEDPKDKVLKKYLTSLCAHQLSRLLRWNLTSVIGKSFIMGMLFFTLMVGATHGLNITLVGLAGILPSNQWLVLFMWYLVGLVGFLLPPIPGPPIYLFGGLVCVDAFKQAADDEETGFIIGIIVVICTAWVLKLNACAMQQKCIGEPLGNLAWIRALVGVQKPVLRAVEVVLRQPGLSLGKCAILCGGPDWPVSVLCGILRCNLFQILLGTTPIVFFIFPTVCAGAFQRRPEKIFATLTSLFYMFAAFMAAFFAVAMGYATQLVLDDHGPLLQIPLDRNRELDWLDYCSSRRSEIYYRNTKWETVPMSVKVVWIAGFFLMSGSCWVFYMRGSDCFGNIQSVLSQPKGGPLRLYWSQTEPTNPNDIQVIKDMGLKTLIAFFLSVLLWYIGYKILNSLVERTIREEEKNFPAERADWERKLELKRDDLEREMRDFYPVDYELYLISTDRPRLPDTDERMQDFSPGQSSKADLNPTNAPKVEKGSSFSDPGNDKQETREPKQERIIDASSELNPDSSFSPIKGNFASSS